MLFSINFWQRIHPLLEKNSFQLEFSAQFQVRRLHSCKRRKGDDAMRLEVKSAFGFGIYRLNTRFLSSFLLKIFFIAVIFPLLNSIWTSTIPQWTVQLYMWTSRLDLEFPVMSNWDSSPRVEFVSLFTIGSLQLPSSRTMHVQDSGI